MVNSFFIEKRNTIIHIIFIVMFSIIFVGCVEVLTPKQQRIQSVTDAYEQTDYMKRETAEEKLAVANRLLSVSSGYRDILLNGGGISRSSTDALRQLERNTTEHAAALLFAAGQQYKNEGKLDKSKQVYKDIIIIFVGSAYSGYRDRARMEMDDLK